MASRRGHRAGQSTGRSFGDRPVFWAGVNYPWKTAGQDFGTGGWGHAGVSDPTTYQEVDVDFANMAAQGVRVVKWRVFSDARYSPEFDAEGTVTGLDEFFFPDLDAALEIATRDHLYLVLTLLSSGFWTADCQNGDVHLGGHAATLLDPGRRRSLIETAIVPTLRRLATSDRVLAFEVIAEPVVGRDGAPSGAGCARQITALGDSRLRQRVRSGRPPAHARTRHRRVQPFQQHAQLAKPGPRLLQL